MGKEEGTSKISDYRAVWLKPGLIIPLGVRERGVGVWCVVCERDRCGTGHIGIMSYNWIRDLLDLMSGLISLYQSLTWTEIGGKKTEPEQLQSAENIADTDTDTDTLRATDTDALSVTNWLLSTFSQAPFCFFPLQCRIGAGSPDPSPRDASKFKQIEFRTSPKDSGDHFWVKS